MEPLKALEILVSLISRTPMSLAEQAGAQAAVDALNKALTPKEDPKEEKSRV